MEGATIWGYREAQLLREIQKQDRELFSVINVSNLEEITGQKFNGAEQMPYFGAILTDKGGELMKGYHENGVFIWRLSDYEAVAAPTLAQALEWYEEQTGITEDDRYSIQEIEIMKLDRLIYIEEGQPEQETLRESLERHYDFVCHEPYFAITWD